MKKIYALLVLILCFISPLIMKAQIGVTVTNNTNTTPNLALTYTSLANALTDLNAVTAMTGPVILTLDAGASETAPATGLGIGSASLNAVLSATNTVTVVKAAGAATVLNAGTGGTGTPSTAVQNGILKIVGADYITIDGLSLVDGNAAAPATMEYGIGLFKLSATDGARFNTIQNCIITLNRNNNAAGAGPAAIGSRGINVVNSTDIAQTTAITVTNATGTNSGNKFYSNTIQNTNIGVSLAGFAAASPYTNADQSNDVGGASNATTNLILNFGGGIGATNAAYGIYTFAQYGINLSFNNINNNNGSGVKHVTNLSAVYLGTAVNASSTVSNNTISIQAGGAGTVPLYVIENQSGGSGNGNTLDISGNIFSGCTYLTHSSGAVRFIYNASQGVNNSVSNLVISSNTINPISLNPGGGTGIISMIYQDGVIGTLSDINSNFFVDQSWNTTGNAYLIYDNNNTQNISISGNKISGICEKTGAGGTFYGYYNFGSPTFGTALVTGNNFSKVTLTGGTNFYGIYLATLTNQIEKVNYNTISNITGGTGFTIGIHHNYGAAGSEVTGNNINIFNGGGTVTGIQLGNATASLGLSVADNKVHDIFTTGTSANGIIHTSGVASSILRNKVYLIRATNTSGISSGVVITGGTTVTVYNNIIGNIQSPSTALDNAAIGLSVTGGTTVNAYYNTVYLNATSTGNPFGSSAVSVTTTPTVNLRNNIFVNNSTPVGAGLTVAYRRSSTTLSSYASSSNTNLFYAGTPGATRLIFHDGATGDQTLAAFKTRVAPRDVASVTENPTFISLAGANANFLHINAATPTQIESGAINISPIEDDYDVDDIRQGNPGYAGSGTAPDIGADEGDFTLLDLTPPVISAVTFTSPSCGTLTRTFTATITDASGVNNAGFKPRVYFRKNASTYVSTPGVLTAGTVNNGTWTFTIDYSLLVPPTAGLGDIIDYFIVAQDAAVTPNVTGVPVTGLVLTNVNTVTTPPTAPYTFTIANALSGTYNVGGAFPPYTTLTLAVQAYNTSCLTGPVTFVLRDPGYSAGETFPIIINANPDASAVNTLTIKPFTGLSPVISGSTTDAIIQYNGADYVTIDGSNNGTTSRNLTIANTNASTDNAVIWLNYTTDLDAATHNTVKNSIITGNAPTTTGFGIFSGDYIGVGYYGLAANNFNTYQNNAISNVNYGIGIGGPSAKEKGITIADNNISIIGYRGIWVANQDTIAITHNTINALSSDNISSSDPTAGIITEGAISGGSISRNTLYDIKNTSPYLDGWASFGIALQSSSANAGITVSNNMIYDVAAYGYGFDALDNGHGIAVTTGGGYNIYYNSINLATNSISGNGISAALYVKNGIAVNSLNIRNNILVNTETTGTNFAIYSGPNNSVYSNINYNDYWTNGANIGYLGGARATLNAWKTASGADLNSVSVNPQFTSAVNLHLNVASSTLDGLATPIAGITTDYDLDTRNVTTPDIGADEFTLNPCTGAVGGTATGNGNVTLCVSGLPTITASGYSIGTGSGYQWQSSLDNFVTAPLDIAGQINPANLTLGSIGVTTYYRLKVTCPSGAALAYSNTVTIIVNTPAVSSPVNGTRCGTGTVNISAAPSSGASINWYAAPTGGLPLFTGNTYTTPVLTTGVTTYYASASNGGVSESVGKASSPGSDAGYNGTATGIVFNATQNLTLVSTVVYPLGSGNITIALYDNAGVELLSTASIAVSGSGTSTPVTVPLGFAVPAGTGYRLLVKANSGVDLLRDFSGNTFPYNSVSGAMSVTNGWISGTAGTYYFFYNLLLSTACESARTAITATVTAATPITASASPATICEGFSSTLSVSSALGTYVYTWSPAGPGSVSPVTTTKYIVNALAPGGCTAIDSVTITVNPKPGAITLSPASPNICGSGSATITASGGIYSGVATANSGVISVIVPDANATGTSTSLSIAGVPAGATIDSVIVSFNINHLYDDEMILNLEAPNGQIINLVSGQSVPFGGDDFLNTRITSDNAFNNISSGTAPFTGTFKADAATTFGLTPSPIPTTTTWAPLYGTPNGNWTLRLHDDSNGDLGTLTNWSIKIAYSALPAWSWSPGSFLNTTAGNVVISSTPLTQTYTVTATNATGCINTKPVTVNVVSYPVSVTIAAVPNAAICAGTSVTFTATPTNGGATPNYTWKVGATTVFSGVGAGFSSYTTTSLLNGDVVTCIVASSIVSCTTNNPATSNAITMVVNPTTPTSVSVSGSPAGAVCAGTSVTFTANPVNPGLSPTYEWFIGGVSQGAPSASTTFSPGPLTNGQVITCRMVSSATNCPFPINPTSANYTMVVNPIVPVTVSMVQVPAGSICIGSSVTYTATPSVLSGGPLYEFFVDGVSQGAPSGTATFTTSTLAAGSRIIDCNVTYSSNPCVTPIPAVGSITTSVTASITPTVLLSPKADVCPGSTVLYTATPTTGGALNYEFFVNGISQGAPSATNTFSHSFAVSQIISVVMTTSSGCATSTTATDTYTQLLYTPPSAGITGSNTMCPGIPILLNSNGVAGSGTISSYQWKLGGVNIPSATSATYVATAPGNYTVVVTNSNTCAVTSTIFTINPGATLMAGPYTIGAITATAAAGSAGTTINVVTTSNLVVGAAVTITSGSGIFQANTIITNILGPSSFSIDKAPTTLPVAGDIIAGATCTNYISFKAAVSDLNTRTISASCTFDVTSGYIENLPSQLVLGTGALNATVTVAKTITFQKNGAGANPKISTAFAGTGLPNGTGATNPDGIFSINGTDYVTIDAIDLQDNNIASPTTMMEFGYGLFKLNATDGTQKSIIKNCNITLNKANNATATAPMVEGSVGILVINATNTAATAALTVTAASGSNSGNKFYSNSIQNCNYGIVLSGFGASSGVGPTPTPATFLGDLNNEAGGNAAGLGNTISNYGGGGGNTAAGVRATNQWSSIIAYNTITSNSHAGIVKGIWGESGTSANTTITFNTISVNGGVAGAIAVTAIENGIGTTAASNVVAITNNTITGSYPFMTTGSWTGILNTAAATTVNLNDNKIDNVTLPVSVTTGVFTGISNTAAAANVNINVNRVQGNTQPGTGTFLAITNSGAVITTLSISNNNINSNTKSGTGTMSLIAPGNPVALLTTTISTNQISNNLVNGGNTNVVLNGIVTPAVNNNNTYVITNNTIFNNRVTGMSNPAIASIYGYNNQAGTLSETVTGNSIYDLYVNSSSKGVNIITGILNNTSNSSTRVVSGNSIYNLYTNSGASATIYAIQGQKGGTVSNLKNKIYNLFPGQAASTTVTANAASVASTINVTSTANLGIGMTVTVTSGTGAFVANTTVATIVSATQFTVSTAPSTNLATGATIFANPNSVARGIGVSLGTTSVTISNNMIAIDLAQAASATASVAGSGVLTNSDALRGIEITSAVAGSNINVYYNSIRLGGTGGTGFGCSGIYHTTSTTSTIAALNLRNNIIDNETTPNGGLVVAYRRSLGTANHLSNYGASSNNNDFYAGTPSANNLLYSDGTSSAQNITAYKGGVFTAGTVAPRDAASISELPVFVNPAIGDLRLGADNCNINGAGAGIAGFTDDYEGDARLAAGITDIGADEIATPANPLTAFNVNNPAAVCSGGSIDLTAGAITAGSAGGTGFYYFSDATGLTPLATPNNITVGGTYFIKYYKGNCYFNADTIKPVVVTFSANGTWIGGTAGFLTDWNTASNWCGGIPNSATNVIIPVTANNPVLSSGVGLVNNLTLTGAATLTISGGVSLSIAGSITSPNNAINATAGAIKLNGASAQTLNANPFVGNTIDSITISNTSGVTISAAGPMLKVTRAVGFGAVNGAILTTNDKLTLVSTATGTARIADVTNGDINTGNNVTGHVVIERFIPANRKWRLLGVPIKSSTLPVPTISNNWQEGGRSYPLATLANPVPGYGTHITFGNNQAGYDQNTTNRASIFYMSPSGWTLSPSATNGTTIGGNDGVITDQPGYLVFVRGDRSINLSQNQYAPTTTTTLRITGDINVTSNSASPLTVAGKGSYINPLFPAITYNMWSNPYPSAINFHKIKLTNPAIPDQFYLWDANVTGSNGVGGWVELNWNSGTSSYDKNIVPPIVAGTSIDGTGDIQSGTAFGVAYIGNISFKESHKASGSNIAMLRPSGRSNRSQFRTTLLAKNNDGTISANDGLLITFNNSENNGFDASDMPKMPNFAENIAVKNENQLISIERRQPPADRDTFFFNLSKMRIKNYQLEFALENLNAAQGTSPFLEDLFLGSKTALTIEDTSRYDFSVTSDSASYSADRFRIIFKQFVKFATIKGDVVDNDILVSWKVSPEINVKDYKIERSVDGVGFTESGAVLYDASSTGSYSWLDLDPASGIYFYRIKSISNSGAIAYSEVAKVVINRKGNGMYVFPNPATNSTIGLQMNLMPAGAYTARLLNDAGQVVASKLLQHPGGTSSLSIIPEHALISGAYQLEVTGPDKKKVVLKVIVQTK